MDENFKMLLIQNMADLLEYKKLLLLLVALVFYNFLQTIFAIENAKNFVFFL